MKTPILSLLLLCYVVPVVAQETTSGHTDAIGDSTRTFTSDDSTLYAYPRFAERADSGVVIIPSTSRPSGTLAPLLRRGLNIQTFEDNYVGYTFDSDDKSFLDFKLSIAYQLSAFGGTGRMSLNFAFTGRFAQYIASRESSPVIGKRFNPYLYLRYNPTWMNRARFRLGYGHESNGQSIIDSLGFYSTVANLTDTLRQNPLSQAEAMQQTLDQLSRGWDYIGFSWTHRLLTSRPHSDALIQGYMLVEGAYRGYLKRGLMQGPREEYQAWERPWATPGIIHRSQVSGINLAAEYFFTASPALPKGAALRALDHVKLAYTTGSSQPFAYHSILAQAGLRVSRVRIAATYTNGYDGDIAQYGKRNHSWGVSFILNSFVDPLSLTTTSR